MRRTLMMGGWTAWGLLIDMPCRPWQPVTMSQRLCLSCPKCETHDNMVNQGVDHLIDQSTVASMLSPSKQAVLHTKQHVCCSKQSPL